MQSVRFRGKTTVTGTTAVGTTTAGAYLQYTVAGNSAAIVGAEMATVSTLFARYRFNRLRVSVRTYYTSSNRYWGVKYVGEDTAAPGVVTCLSLLDGMHSDCRGVPEILPAQITLNNAELRSSGLEWRECDSATEALGQYGEITVVSELATQVVVTFDWDISFADLASSGLHLSPLGKALGKMTPGQIIALTRFPPPAPVDRNGDGFVRVDAPASDQGRRPEDQAHPAQNHHDRVLAQINALAALQRPVTGKYSGQQRNLQ